MRIDACFFVDDSEVIILEYDLEWHILSDERHLIDSPADLDDISSIYLFVFGKIGTIAGDLPFFYHLLEIAPRLFWKKSRQVSVDSSRLSRIGENTECR